MSPAVISEKHARGTDHDDLRAVLSGRRKYFMPGNRDAPRAEDRASRDVDPPARSWVTGGPTPSNSPASALLDLGAVAAMLYELERAGFEVWMEGGTVVCRPSKGISDWLGVFLREEKAGLVRYFATKERRARAPRGTGLVSIPHAPVRPASIPPAWRGLVELGEQLHDDLVRLHRVYTNTIDFSFRTFSPLLKKGHIIRAESDPVVDLAKAVETCKVETAPMLATVERRLQSWKEALSAAPTSENERSVAELGLEIDRLVKGLPYARTCMLFVEHVLLALTTSFVSRQRVWGIQSGAQVASLIAACRALKPKLDDIGEALPLREFGLVGGDGHNAGEHELRQALEAIARAVLSPAKKRGQQARSGRVAIIRSAVATLGMNGPDFVRPVAVEVALDGWGHLPLMTLYAAALAGKLHVALKRVSDRALDEAGAEVRETQSSLSTERRDSTMARLIEKYERKTKEPALLDGVATTKFQKFVERSTRYTPRRVGFDVLVPRGARHRSDLEESGGKEGHSLAGDADVLPTETQRVSAFSSEPPPSPSEIVEGGELGDLLAADPDLSAVVEAALDDPKRTAMASRLHLTTGGVSKRLVRVGRVVEKRNRLT